MKRGFPRPQTKIDKVSVASLWPVREKWENRSYPHPYTARTDKISRMHYGRIKDCIYFKKCSACGEHIAEENVTVLLEHGQYMPDSGPFHEKCARLVQTMCPIVHEQMEVPAGNPADSTKRFRFEVHNWSVASKGIQEAFRDSYGSCPDMPET